VAVDKARVPQWDRVSSKAGWEARRDNELHNVIATVSRPRTNNAINSAPVIGRATKSEPALATWRSLPAAPTSMRTRHAGSVTRFKNNSRPCNSNKSN